MKTIYSISDYSSIWKITAQNAKETVKIQDRLKDYFKTLSKMSLNNKSDLRKVFTGFVDMLGFGSRTNTLDILKKYALATEEHFRSFILNSHDEFEKYKYKIDWVKQWDESEAEKAYKLAKENGEIPDVIADENAEERDIIIYDRFNPYTHSVYAFKGKRGKNTDHQVNILRMDFMYEYGVKYWDCYSMLAKNYFGHEEDLKKRAEFEIENMN